MGIALIVVAVAILLNLLWLSAAVRYQSRMIMGLESTLRDLITFLSDSGPEPTPTAMSVVQLQGGTMSTSTPTILGITLGNTGTFQEVVTAPAGAAFPAGTTFTWTATGSTLLALTPSSDGTQVAVATTAGDPATSFQLTCTSSFTPPNATAPLSATVTVPLTPAAPPPVPTPTAMGINQLS
jgi:hypothetical protein